MIKPVYTISEKLRCRSACTSVQSDYVAVVLVFYSPSTLFKSFQVRSVNLSTLFQGKPPRQFTST